MRSAHQGGVWSISIRQQAILLLCMVRSLLYSPVASIRLAGQPSRTGSLTSCPNALPTSTHQLPLGRRARASGYLEFLSTDVCRKNNCRTHPYFCVPNRAAQDVTAFDRKCFAYSALSSKVAHLASWFVSTISGESHAALEAECPGVRAAGRLALHPESGEEMLLPAWVHPTPLWFRHSSWVLYR